MICGCVATKSGAGSTRTIQQPVVHQLPQRHPFRLPARGRPARAGPLPGTGGIPGRGRHRAAAGQDGLYLRVSPVPGLHHRSPPTAPGVPTRRITTLSNSFTRLE
jgi:hypothetical protein